MASNIVASACWQAVGGDIADLDGLTVTDQGAWLGGPLAVDDLAVGTVAAALLAAAELAQARNGRRPAIQLSAEHVALSFRSERNLLVRGEPAPVPFAPLSRFVQCADGWARTHGTFRHHAAALARALEIDPGLPPARALDALNGAAASMPAVALEERVYDAGGCAAALRSKPEWLRHPAGLAAASNPLVGFDRELSTSCSGRLGRLSGLPCSGIRVLDLTRVIAGPVAGRTLAGLGAHVLRVDPPGLPELPEHHLDTGPGKRAATLDLADAERREPLLAGADVVLIGYRPGALDRFGMRPDALAERHPHLVQVSLSAWGTRGPWATRRGFDSLVQVASGIAAACAADDGSPGVLPAPALRGLAQRARGEPVAPASLSLGRTAAFLLEAPRPEAAQTELAGRADPERCRVGFEELDLIAPPGLLDATPLRWAHGPRPLGADPPAWW
jgi:crotonobetainyl-CoA:carnitine CoA-transferase CaiB-like acyl-CoA transferase